MYILYSLATLCLNVILQCFDQCFDFMLFTMGNQPVFAKTENQILFGRESFRAVRSLDIKAPPFPCLSIQYISVLDPDFSVTVSAVVLF